MFISLLCSVFIKSVNSAPRKANVKRAASNKRASVVSSSSNKRAASSSSSSSASSKRAANTSSRARRQAGVGNPNTSSQSSSVSSSASTSVSGNSCPVVDTETLNNILAEIKSLKDMLASGNVSVNTSASTSVNTSSTTSLSTTSAYTPTSSANNTVEPKYTGKIFKGAEINLNEGQGYYLADIVNESNLSKYDTTRFYFSRCGFRGDFIVPVEKCFDGNNLSASQQSECSRNGYTSFSLGPEWSPNTSYNLNNTFMSYSDGRNDYPISVLGKYYKGKTGWLKPAGYIKYYPTSAIDCPNYNFVKAVTSSGEEDWVKINIKAVNNIPYTPGTKAKVVWTGKVFKSPNLQLKEGNTYKLKDIMNLPEYGSKDIYGRTLSSIFAYVSNCGMTLYDGISTKDGKLEDLQSKYGYSTASAKELYLNSANAFSTAYVKVLVGAKDKCKTNFIHISGNNNVRPYTDATNIEFISNSSSSTTTTTIKTVGGCGGR